MIVRRALPLLALAVLLPACGSSPPKAGPAGGAEVAPASTQRFARLSTADKTSRLFRFLAGLTGETLPAGVGPEVDAATLGSAGLTVALTQPADRAQLQTSLAKQGIVSEPVENWTVIARNRRAIDRFKAARNDGTLDADQAYQDATSGLPQPSLASVYLTGDAFTKAAGGLLKTSFGPVPGVGRVDWAALSLTSEPGGVGVHGRLKGDELEVSNYTAELPAEVPTPVSLLVDEKGLDATLGEVKRSPGLTKRLGAIGTALASGLLDDLVNLFRGEAALYARPLPDGPEYTLLLKVDDESRANQVLDGLTTLAGAASQSLPAHPSIAGILATKATLGSTTLYYAVVDGKVVVSTKPSGIRGVAMQGPRLAESPRWTAAADSAQLPDQTSGILYADFARSLPLLETLLGATPTPAEEIPFGDGMLWTTVDGSVLTVGGHVAVR